MHGSVRSKVKGIGNNMISLECDIQSRLQPCRFESCIHLHMLSHFFISPLVHWGENGTGKVKGHVRTTEGKCTV